MIRVPPHLGTMFHDVPVPRFGTKFPERGTCPCSRTPAAKVGATRQKEASSSGAPRRCRAGRHGREAQIQAHRVRVKNTPRVPLKVFLTLDTMFDYSFYLFFLQTIKINKLILKYL
jgi:hypothetical protein